MSAKKEEQTSQVRIAVTHVTGEIVFETNQSPADIKSALTAALSAGTPLSLTDIRGREFIVPADKIGFVDIGESAERRVGFGAR